MNNSNSTSKSHILAATSAMVVLFCYAVVLTIQQASTNQVEQAFSLTNSSMAVVVRLFMLGFFIAAITGGRLSDRYGRLPVITSGAILMSLGMLAYFRAPSFGALPYAALVAGVGGGLCEVISMAALADIYQGARRTAIMNWAQVVFAAGAACQPLVFAGMLRAGIGWREGYLVAALLSAVGALVAGTAAVRECRGDSLRIANGGDWRAIMRNHTIARLCTGLFLYVGAEIGLASWVAIYMSKNLRASDATSAAAVAVLWTGIGVGRVVTTRLVGKFSDDALIRWSAALGAIAISALLMARDPAVGLLLMFFAGLPLGPAWPTIVSRTGQEFPTQSGTAIGIVAAAGCLGGAVIPPLIGWMSDKTGMRMALWISVAALVLALAVMTPGRRGRDV